MKTDDLKALSISPDASLRAAIEAIDRSKRQISLVVDANGRLVATVTDGDVRRGMLRGVDLDGSVDQVMHRSPTTITQGAPDAETRRLIRERKLQHVPVLDADGRVVDLATVQDLFGVTPNDTRVILMARGLGTRLRPMTETVPKPMLPVGGKPILEQIIGLFADQGLWRISISVNYRAEVVRDHFGTGEGLGVEIDYLEEKPVERYFVNAGIYVLSPEASHRLTPGTPLDMPELLSAITVDGENVGVYPLPDNCRDIGRIADLEAARSEFDSVFRG